MAHEIAGLWPIRLIMLVLAIVVFPLVYWWSDREPPSYILSMWVIPDVLKVGQPFLVQETFYRRRRCSRTIQQGFVQNDIVYPSGELTIPYPMEMGLLKQRFTSYVPLGMKTDGALYTMVLVWTCPFDPVTWIWPITLALDYPVKVIGDGIP
jgi:hypothetical protein